MNKLFISLLLLTICHPVFAFDKVKLTKKWQHTPFELYLDAQEAYVVFSY